MAARAFNRGPRDRSAGPRRKRIWARTQFDHVLTGGTGATTATDLMALPMLDGLFKAGLTVARIRIQALQAQTLGTQFGTVAAFGIQVNVKDIDADDMLVWTTGAHQDWMAFQPISLLGSTGVDGKVIHSIDVKSQRRIDELDQTLWLVTQNGASAGNTLSMSYSVSTLLLLP